ncbi:MAG TPA: hypothetical protein VLX92_26265 [Kofleriaceae bacterium]|nr:hypothetical protein [Kofleriaceae bacterium]
MQRRIAVSCAVAALGVAAATAIVVLVRSPAPDSAPQIVQVDVTADLLARVTRFGAVVPVDGGGVRVANAALARALGLEPDDVITAISGRPVARDFDVYETIAALHDDGATATFVDRSRGPVVHWRLAPHSGP